MKLFEYQKEGINSLEDFWSWALFVEAGKGKTIMSLELLDRQSIQNVLIVCRKNKFKNWEDDIQAYFGNDINYEVITYHALPKLEAKNYKSFFIILDESQNIKTPNGTRFKKLKTLKRYNCRFGLLSATPQHSLYIDYYSSLFLLDIYEGSLSDYKADYCIYRKTEGGFLDLVGYKHTEEIDKMLLEENIFWYHKKNKLAPIVETIHFERNKEMLKIIKERHFEKKILFDTPGKYDLYKRIVDTGYIHLTSLSNAKVEWIVDKVFDPSKRIVIFTNYLDEMQGISNYLNSQNIKHNLIGGVYNDAVTEMVAVVTFGKMASGTNDFANFDYCIFHSIPVKYIDFAQAIKRVDRVNQVVQTKVYLLLRTSDRQTLKKHHKKLDFDLKFLEGGDLL